MGCVAKWLPQQPAAAMLPVRFSAGNLGGGGRGIYSDLRPVRSQKEVLKTKDYSLGNVRISCIHSIPVQLWRRLCSCALPAVLNMTGFSLVGGAE